MARLLLDRRYAVGKLLCQIAYQQDYLACDVSLDIPVRVAAVTSPKDEWQTDLAHFRSCAVQAAPLRHPALPRLRDFFSSEQHPLEPVTGYAVFDFCPAMPFTTYLERRHVSEVCEALVNGLTLCDALDMVERQAPLLLSHIVVSPRTLCVGGHGRIGLQELGVAGWLLPSMSLIQSAQDGIYAAPEVLEGQTSSGRSSMYSVAAFVWHTLTGTPHPAGTLGQRQDQTAFMIPLAVLSVLTTALEPNPLRRYANMDAFGKALAQATVQVLPPSMKLTRRPGRPFTPRTLTSSVAARVSFSKS